MKSLIAALVVASTTIVPSLSFAQQTSGRTPAEVRSQMACADQQAPVRQSKNYYPAPARMSGTACDVSGYGASVTGNVQAGAPIRQPSVQTLFSHH